MIHVCTTYRLARVPVTVIPLTVLVLSGIVTDEELRSQGGTELNGRIVPGQAPAEACPAPRARKAAAMVNANGVRWKVCMVIIQAD
jgi:hypothetical protein